MFQNKIWQLFKLFETALMVASHYGFTEIVKILLEQQEIDVNAENFYFFQSKFNSII